MIEYDNFAKSNEHLFNEYKEAFNSFINSGSYILGKKVIEFEESFAKYIGSKYFTGVASGYDAIYLSLLACDFEKDSEIIVPSNTYVATILPVLRCGLKPILVEPDIKTYNIDPLKIEEKITKKTKGIYVVHLYGKSCNMDPINKLARKYKLTVFEDCAQAHGSKYKNKTVGTLGSFGAFSFYPGKNLGALGDAGGIAVNDLKYKELLDALRNYGSIKKYENRYIGVNSRLDELQACMLLTKLKNIEIINNNKRLLASIYQKYLKDDFIKPVVDENYYDTYHVYCIRHPQRNKLQEYLLKNDIKTVIHYPIPPHKQEALKNILKGRFPISEEIHNTILSLPISFLHTKEDIYKVIEVMNNF